MFVVLLRHGIAEPRGSRENDDERRLTPAGRRKMKEIAPALAKLFPDVDAIHSSPLPRALETATIVAKSYDLGVQTLDALKPGSDPDEVREFLDKSRVEKLILVGHEPHLSATMLHLTGMGGEMELKKGGCYGVRIEDGTARLEWMLPPRVLRL